MVAEPTSEPRRATESPRKGRADITFDDFVEHCKAVGEDPIPSTDPVFAYAEKIGLPREYLELAWLEFAQQYRGDRRKRYKSWRQTFRNAVTRNWFRLWFERDGAWALTTQGKMAQRAHAAEEHEHA
jgi:hypothetical protein